MNNKIDQSQFDIAEILKQHTAAHKPNLQDILEKGFRYRLIAKRNETNYLNNPQTTYTLERMSDGQQVEVSISKDFEMWNPIESRKTKQGFEFL